MLNAQDAEKVDRPRFLTVRSSINNIDINEVLRDQDKIDKAVLYKLKHQENTYVHLVEIDNQERNSFPRDRYPLFDARIKIWKQYT